MRRLALRSLRHSRWLVAFLVVVAMGIGLNRVFGDPGPYTVLIPVADAAGLYPGSDVMIAGAKAGRVEAVGLSGGAALVTASIDRANAPLHQDATVAIRPKSLLGEMYVALDPGRAAAVLPSGSTLPRTQVNRSTDLEQVINTFDAPTRAKLQTVIVELGGGVAGQGQALNLGIQYGRKDLDDLQAVADTLAQREQDLKTVIQDLAQVTQELAAGDHRDQLAALIQNTDGLMKNLADQEAQLKRMLAETNAALGRTASGLGGTGATLGDLLHQLSYTVREGNLTMTELSGDSGAFVPQLGRFDQAVREGPLVFGGTDASGYATRISLVFGPGTGGVSAGAGPVPVPAGQGLTGAQAAAPASGRAGPAPSDQAETRSGLIGFLLGSPGGAGG